MKVRDLLKTEDVIRVSSEDALSSVLSQLESSHDAAFVFEGKTFLGAVNPYYSLIRKVHPGNTKVHSCLMHPPRLHVEDPIVKAARLMMESKIHYLPVFDDKNDFVGIVSARRILGYMMKSNVGNKDLQKKVSVKKIVTIHGDDPISKALNLFKDNKISKLVLVNEDNVLTGIVSQYDITNPMMTPGQRQGFASRDGNKDSHLSTPIKNFAHTHVQTLRETATYSEIVRHILEQKIGSIVIIDAKRRPVGIITTKDILTFIVPSTSHKTIAASMHDLKPEEEKSLSRALKTIQTLFKKHEIRESNLIAKGKHGTGVYSLTFSFHHQDEYTSIQLESKKFSEMLRDLMVKVKSRLDQ